MTTKQNNINDLFYPWIINTFSPTSLVLSTPNAQKILGKNFLSPSQFLRPFGDLRGLPLKFTFGEKYQNTINDFKFDFYDSKDFVKKELNQINNYIINCLSTETVMPNFDKNFRRLNKDNITQFLFQLNQYSPFYYSEFEKLYFELCKFQESELYQQPLLFIYLCDINDNINIIIDLLNDTLPKLIYSEAYEPKIFELIILLNDISNSSNNNSNKMVLEANFKNKYNSKNTEIFTIDINSGNLNENNNDISDDIWSKYTHKIEEYSDGFETIKRGRYITNNEVNIFRQKFQDYIKDKFRIYLLDLINRIDRNLAKNSGINSLFNKLKGNKNDRQEQIQGFNLPRLSSNERQRYFLSILLFHIRDYMDAYENLKKLKDSIKGKSRDYENAIRQFLVICRYLKKEDKSKIETFEPFYYYLENKQYTLAFRNILLYLKMSEQIKKTNIIENIYKYNYYLANNIVKYFNGLLFEKIGFYHLFSDHPKIRKFALNTLGYATQRYIIEKEDDIKNNYLVQNFGYICDLFKIDFDYSKYDNDVEINTFSMIKKYIFYYLCTSCDVTNNIKFGIPVFINYLRLILLQIYENLSNSDAEQKNNKFEFNENDESKEIEYYFRKLNAIFIKGRINFLDDFPLPIIEDDSLVFYIEQDQKILKDNNKINLNFVESFKKYLELSIEQKYSVLSEEDISCLRFIDEQSSRNFVSNYFMKTVNNVKVGEQIFIKFNISNPLTVNLPIKNLTLIITKKNLDNNLSNNESEYNCGYSDIELPSKTMHGLGIKVIFNSPGLFEISGLTMTLFKNINIRYFFNKKTMNTLYLNKKKNSNDSENENYTKHIKQNFCFNVIESNKSISINVNNDNNKMSFFQNQINYLIIKIHNNNNDIEIRKYTIFLGADNDILLYPKYLHKNYLTPTNTILIPIIGLKVGECKLKIIIKYEEKTNKSSLDIYRNVLSIKVFKGVNLNIEDNIYEFNKIINRRLIKINMDIVKNMNIQNISFSKNKSILINKQKFLIENFIEDDNENQKIDIQSKNINQKIILKLLDNEKKEEYNNDQLIDELIGNKKKQDQNNYPHIREFFKEKFSNENNLILKYKINFMDNNGVTSFNCIYKHEIKINKIPFMKTFYVDNLYLKNNLMKYFNINFEVEDFDDNQKYITINIQLLNDNENFEKIGKIIDYIEIKVDDSDNNFEWIGLYSTKFKNVMKINKEENIKYFNCILNRESCSLSDKKNEINLNHFIFLVKIKNSNLIYQYNDFPYSIYYNKESGLI